MKKIFTFFCLLMLGAGMSAWASNPMKRPDKIVLRQTAANATTFNVEGPASVWEHSGRSGNCLQLYSVDLGSQNALNGAFSVSSESNTHYYYTGDASNDQLYLHRAVIYFSYVSGNSNSNYVYNVRVEPRLKPDGDGYTYGIYNTSGNGIAAFENAHWDNVPIEIYDYSGNPITIVEQPINLAMDFIYGKSGHNISLSDFSYETNWMYYDNTKRHFFKVVAYDNSKTTDNYVVLCFWMAANQGISYNGTIGPAQKQYDVFLWTSDNYYEDDGETWYNKSYYWLPIGGTYNNYVIDYISDEDINGECRASSYYADYNNGTVSNKREISTIADNVVVRKGAGGNIEVDVRWGSANVITIRELLENGVINAVPNYSNRGSVTGTITTNGDFVTGTTYDGGTHITLNANALSGYTFLKWDDEVTDNPRSISVNGTATYTAVFTPTCTITVTPDDASHGSTSGSGSYAEGATVEISASGLTGYVFSHWDDDNTDNPRTITVSSSKTTFTAYFEEITSSMSIVSPCSNADIYAHFTYSNLSTSVTQQEGYNRFTADGQNLYNVCKITAQNSLNDRLTLYIFPTDTRTYQGGECTNKLNNAPLANTYSLAKQGLYASSSYDVWYVSFNTAFVYKYLSNYNATCSHCDIIMQNNSNKHWDLDVGGSIIVRENNVGGMFIETSNVTEDANGQSVYFTVGNRSENTFAPSTATMSFTGSYLTMTATDNSGNNARITVKNFNTNNNSYSLNGTSDFDLDHCSLYYDGDYIEEIQSISGTIQRSVSAGIIYYTLSNVKIRTCQEDLYIINMTAPAPSYTLTWNKNAEDATLTGGTTAGAVQFTQTLTAPTATRTGYTFNGWSPTFTGTMPAANTTYVVQWTPQTYDITYKDKDNADYSGSNLASLPATHTYNTPTNLVAGVKSGYNFLGWYENENCEGDAVTSIGATAKTANFTLYAKWERNVVSYNVTFTAGEHGSVSGAIGETAITSGQPQEEGSTVTLTATPDNFYSFVEWRNASNEQVVSTNAEYSFTLAEAVNLTAVFALQETIELTDNFENGSQWQDDYADLLDMLRTGSDKAGKAKQKDVQLNRTFAAERWSTFALPFGYSLSSNQTHPFYGHVYSLVSAQYEEKGGKGYLTLNCMPNTTSIKANTPYVLITDKDAPIANPVFNNVRLTEIEENTTTVVQDVNNTGSVRFVNTEYRQRIDKIEQYGVNSKENKSVIYLSGNKLYYPGGAIYQNAFRAYFVMNYSTIYHVAPRVRLVMPNGESVEQAEEETVETKKYIENGILVIERNGIKYDAQGHVIK